MRITKWTKTRDILPILPDKEAWEKVLEAVPPMPLRRPLLSMTVGEVAEIFDDPDTYMALILSERRALKAFGRLKQFNSEVDGISKFIKMYDFKKTQEEEQAARGIVFPTMSQRMLLDCVKFFHLHSMKEAEKVPFADWLTVFQDEASSAKFQRNYSKIIEQKHRLQSKKR